MKTRILLASALLLCYPFLSNGQGKKGRPLPGSDRDAHGCIPSAGYTWSAIKKDCIRTFEQDVRLSEVNPKGTASFLAAVIFSDDKKKAEVFMVDQKEGLILNYNPKSKTWRRGNIVLAQKNGYTISRGNKIIYAEKDM